MNKNSTDGRRKIKIGDLSQIRPRSSQTNDVITSRRRTSLISFGDPQIRAHSSKRNDVIASRRTSLVSFDDRSLLHNNNNNNNNHTFKPLKQAQLLKLRRNTLSALRTMDSGDEVRLQAADAERWSNLIPDKQTPPHPTALLLNVVRSQLESTTTTGQVGGGLEITSPLSSTASSPQFSDDDDDDVVVVGRCGGGKSSSLVEPVVVQDFIFSNPPPHLDGDGDYDVTVPAGCGDGGGGEDIVVDNRERTQKSEVWEIGTTEMSTTISQLRRPSQLGGTAGGGQQRSSMNQLTGTDGEFRGPLPVIRPCRSMTNEMMTGPGKLSAPDTCPMDRRTKQRSEDICSSDSSLVFSVDDSHSGGGGFDEQHMTAPPRGGHEEGASDGELTTTLPTRPTMRRTAVVSTLPESDLSVLSDRIASLQRNQPMGICADIKRSRWNLGKLGFKHNKDRCSEAKLISAMNELKCKDDDEGVDERLQQLIKFQYDDSSHSSEASFKQYADVTTEEYHMTSREVKHYEAVKELFTTERSFLIGHILVLLEVFLEPLQQLQCDGHLLHVDARTVFGNIEELCSVTLHFCENLLHVVKNSSTTDGHAEGILSAFETFESSICPPYQRYFSAFENSVTYTEELKSDNDFITFLQWCELNPRCHRLKLNDFLVSPMQHLTKYPLLLRHIIKYTDDTNQTNALKRTASVVEESLKTLEGKVTCLAKYQLLQDLQSTIAWPPVYEIEPKSVIPESLRQALKHQPCRNLLASAKRRLELEGVLSVIESGKTMEVYAFLFDDFLLLTKPRKRKRRQCEIPASLKRHPYMRDGTLLSVYRQPVALDRFMVYDIGADLPPNSTAQKRAFVVVQENRFQQMTSAVMLEASTEEEKRVWLTAIAKTAANWMEKHVYKIFPSDSPTEPLTSPYLHRDTSTPAATTTTTDTKKLFVVCNNTSSTTEHHENTNDGCSSRTEERHSEFEYFAAVNKSFSVSSSSENGDVK